MKLKNYYMEASSEAMKVMEQPKQVSLSGRTPHQRKVKYQTKTKGYSEDQDFLYYNNFTDERELAEVTNFKYTLDSSDDSSY